MNKMSPLTPSEPGLLCSSSDKDPNNDLAYHHLLVMNNLIHWKTEIEKTLEHAGGVYSFDNIVADVILGKLEFYSYSKCFIIMQEITFPQAKHYHCFMAGGEMKAIMDQQKYKEAEAIARGCDRLTICGRTGWARALKDHGWEHRYSTLYMELDK